MVYPMTETPIDTLPGDAVLVETGEEYEEISKTQRVIHQADQPLYLVDDVHVRYVRADQDDPAFVPM